MEMKGINNTITMSSIVPNDGHIRIFKVLAAVDECVDAVLRLLRRGKVKDYELVGVGFSSFVANLVGVDINAEPVSEVATVSYACNREDVVEECMVLRE